MSGKVPWDELTKQQKEEFARLCDEFVGIKTVEDAKKYYGNKEQLIADSKQVTNQ